MPKGKPTAHILKFIVSKMYLWPSSWAAIVCEIKLKFSSTMDWLRVEQIAPRYANPEMIIKKWY